MSTPPDPRYLSTSSVQLRPGHVFTSRELRTLAGPLVQVPDAHRLVHLQLRRYAGCPICSLHLRSFARRRADLEAAGVREVVVFHSAAEELRKVQADLPFDVVPDPERMLYRELGVTTSPRAVLDPRAWLAAAHAVAARASADPTAGVASGSFGLPGDFLVAPNGRLQAVKYGTHADDQWSLDEVLALARKASAA
jgi:hypothetical protein